jgi:FkbM family methyltransferase
VERGCPGPRRGPWEERSPIRFPRASARESRSGVYWRLRSSPVYEAYWHSIGGTALRERASEVDFYRTYLRGFRPGSVIVDVGANVGDKTDIFLRLGARVIAIDPDESAQRILRYRFLWWRLRPKPVTVVACALSDTDATRTLLIERPGSALNTLTRKWADLLRDDQRFSRTFSFESTREVSTLTLDTIIKRHGRPFFIKIDVEGHEPEVLRGLTQPVPYVSFEVNLPEFRDEGTVCVERLHGLAPEGVFNYTVDCRQFALPHWVPAPQLIDALRTCRERGIEVFFAARC